MENIFSNPIMHNLFLGVLGLLLTLAGYFLGRKTFYSESTKTFLELHKYFWDDNSVIQVRKWLACDDAYNTELKPILLKRILDVNQAIENQKKSNSTQSVLNNEYECLEKLDKFLHSLIRVYNYSHILSKKFEPALKDYFFDYWEQRAFERKEINVYIDTYYSYEPFISDLKKFNEKNK
jgi:hypothetical protein